MRTKELIIVGGPSGAGKTFLLKRIKKGWFPRLSDQLEVGAPSSWCYVSAGKLPRMEQTYVERLIIHYDFLVQQSREDGFNYIDTLIRRSGRVTILTLYASPEILARRMRSRIIVRFGILLLHLGTSKKRIRRYLKVCRKRKVYTDGYSLAALYRKWFSFLDQYGLQRNLVLDSSTPHMSMAQPYEPVRAKVLMVYPPPRCRSV